MRIQDYVDYNPLQVPHSIRRDEVTNLTSARAGRVIPVAYGVLLREDRVRRGNYTVHVQMNETVKTLLNGVKVRAYAHLWPFAADDRFDGMDHFNRSYSKQKEADGSVTPFFDLTQNYVAANDKIFNSLGIHNPDGASVNKALYRAYNHIWNHRAAARSKHIELRGQVDRASLAPAFWNNPLNTMIVPDYEQAMIDGEIPLEFNRSLIPVRGLGYDATQGSYPDNANIQWSGNKHVLKTNQRGAAAGVTLALKNDLVPAIFAELHQSGATISLANIEAARKTAAYAQLRERFKGVDEDYLTDLLMSGIRIPDEQMRNPMLLAKTESMIGYTKRYATDGQSLGESVTVGETMLNLKFQTPYINTGGIIMITMEIVPDQIFERMADPFVRMEDPEDFPEFIRDDLDPEKVQAVKNKYIDVLHSDPDGLFGYAPLNYAWKRKRHNIGGKFMRPVSDAFVEDRQRIWSIIETDPQLSENFYLCKDLHHDVFADTASDPFEIVTIGGLEIEGNTVFGKGLNEADNNYAAVAEGVDYQTAAANEEGAISKRMSKYLEERDDA